MRRCWQFRLRTLFVLTALAALASVLFPPLYEQYREYRLRRLSAKIDALILEKLNAMPIGPSLSHREPPPLLFGDPPAENR